MLNDLPTFIDPAQLAHHHSRLKGHVTLAQMTRVHGSLSDIQGDVFIDWQFDMDRKYRITINGQIQTQLIMLCMRCMQPMPWTIDAKTTLILLNDGQSPDEIPDDYESISLTTTPTSLISLIEDELILALPLVARHTVCPSNEYLFSESITEPLTPPNPFHILSQLEK
jgi:uncharacterized protein